MLSKTRSRILLLLVYVLVFTGLSVPSALTQQIPFFCGGEEQRPCGLGANRACKHGHVTSSDGLCRRSSRKRDLNPGNVKKTSIYVQFLDGGSSLPGLRDIYAKGSFAVIDNPGNAFFHVPDGRLKPTLCRASTSYQKYYASYCPSHGTEAICKGVKQIPRLNCDPHIQTSRTRYPCNKLGLKDKRGRLLNVPMRTLSEWQKYSRRPSGKYIMFNANWFDTLGPAGFPNIVPCTRIYGLSVSDGEVVSSHHDLEQYKSEMLDAFVVMESDGPNNYDVAFKTGSELIAMQRDGSFSKIKYAIGGFIVPSPMDYDRRLPQTGKPRKPAARTIIGLNDDASKMFVAVFHVGLEYGENGTPRPASGGLSMIQAGNFMNTRFGASQVMVLDGGGSSQFLSLQGTGNKIDWITPYSSFSEVYGPGHRPIPNFMMIGVTEPTREKRSIGQANIGDFDYVGRYYSNDEYLYDNGNLSSARGSLNDCAALCGSLGECTHFTYAFPDTDRVCTLFRGTVNKLPATNEYNLYTKR